jgi:hypothetical protein
LYQNSKEPVHNPESRYLCIYCGKEFRTGRQVLGHAVGKHVGRPRLRTTTISVSHLTMQQRGYLAAFLDGEGGIQITKSLRKNRRRRISLHPVVYFTNSNFEVIKTIKTWLKAGVMIVARQREGHRPLYVLHITGIRNIRRLLSALLPLLIVKKAQAGVMLEFCRSRVGLRGPEGRRFSAHELSLYRALKKLNLKHRGKIDAHPRITD